MKKTLLTLLFLSCAAPLFAQSFTATIRRAPAPEETRLAPPSPSEGALQRAARSGNPLQVLNPLAPREYGSGRDFVTVERDPFQHPYGSVARPIAVRLVAAEF